MASHLSEKGLIDALDGVEDPAARAHLRACVDCASRLREVEQTVRLASGVDVPEPSPLYWETFREDVGRRLGEQRPSLGWKRFWIPGLMAAAAAATLVIVTFGPPAPRPSTTAAGSLPAWSALPDEDDEALTVLERLGPSEEEVEFLAGDSGVADRIADLTDEQSRALAEALRDDWAGRKL